MGLKQDIVVVNEFSVPLPGGKGSRGATPGSYVEHYMAREQAVESLAPIQRLRTDDFILRYMARRDAVEAVGVTRSGAKTEMRQAQGNGGVAFGYGSLSLSDEQLRAASADIQRLFDGGKTVLKTVLSFDESYLKRHHIVGEDFSCREPGDYRGHLDQMKLRMAIMHGLHRMAAGSGNNFDDLRYVGVIQVDTEHVHCHLAMVDAGRGQITADGTQRGKLLPRHTSRLRRGVNAWLDDQRAVAHLSSAVGYERRNVTTFIKRWAHERIRTEALPQFLLACLPADRRLWRAGSHDRAMAKANRLVTELVAEQLQRPGSPLPAAMEKVTDYADSRQRSEDLGPIARQKLLDNGRRQITERAVNGVYQVLRALPESELRVRTPMLEVMGMDYQQLAATRRSDEQESDLVSFGFRLRSYSSRLQHHRSQAGSYRDLAQQWERADSAAVADADSRPLYDFYRFEQDYHDRLMSKYQHFLPFVGDAAQWYEQQQQVAAYGQRLLSLTALRFDAALQRMKDADEAERLGRAVYDCSGGRHLVGGRTGRAVLDARLGTMRRRYDEQVQQLREELSAAGLVLRAVPITEDSTGTPPTLVTGDLHIAAGTRHPFDEVKALDLHHLGYDFVTDIPIGDRSRRSFTTAATRRRELLMGAMDYLDQTGQGEAITDLPVEDVAAMAKLSRSLISPAASRSESSPVLPSQIARLRAEQDQDDPQPRSKTTPLDAALAVRVQAQVEAITAAGGGHLLEEPPQNGHSTDSESSPDTPIRLLVE